MLNLFDKINSLQSLHWFARGVLKSQGYQWEVRRSGEVKLGYWRKTFRKTHKKPYPKRFVLIPGFGDTPLSWYSILVMLSPILRKNYDEIIFFDFPGFGGFLSRERAFSSMDFMMSALSDALDSLKPHTILGHSLGGWLTGHYAALCGAQARPLANRLNYSGPETVILVNPSGIFYDEKVQKNFETIFRSSMENGFEALRPHLFAKEPFWFRCVHSSFSKFITRDDILQFMQSVREDHGLVESASQIEANVWLLWGERDSLIPSSCALTWLRHLRMHPSRVRHAVLLRRSGHSPHIEEPAVTAAALAQMLTHRKPHRLGNHWWRVFGNEVVQIP